MATRPCKPGADVKRMWQLLLPDAPFPACGTPEDKGAESAPQSDLPAQAPRDDAPTRRYRRLRKHP